MFVYLLWDHDEHGPESLLATLDRGALPKLCSQYCATMPADDRSAFADALEALLLKPDSDLVTDTGGHQLRAGWGGLHLSVVRLA